VTESIPFADTGSPGGLQRRSKGPQRHVLLVGALEGGLDRVAPMLQREEFDVHAVEPTEFVLDLVMGTPFELLILGYPMPEIDISELIRAVRHDVSASRSAGLLLLSEPAFLEAAQGLVAVGANRAVSLDWVGSRLWQAVGDLLSVAPRVGMRALVYADVEATDGHNRSLYQTVNVSATGMLLSGAEAFSLGSRFDFVFCLPGEPRPIQGTAEIVRRTNAQLEGTQGIGARFIHLKEDGPYRLERFVSSRV
jgi:CheY-like chemotaxis protein